MSRSRRRGSTLVELLVSLPLAVLAAAAAAVLLVRVARSARAQSSALAGARELRHARLVLTADLEPLAGRDLHLVSDSLLEFRGQLGALYLCAAPAPDAIDAMAPAGSSDSWVASLRPGDVVRLWQAARDSTTLPGSPPIPHTRVVTAPANALGPGTCGADSTTHPRRWRLTFADSAPHLLVGAMATAHRDVRYRHYRSGSAFWLGRQTRDGVLWDGVQPVAGPLRSPAQHGMQLHVTASNGDALVVNGGTTDSLRARAAIVHLTLRAERRVREVWSPHSDSMSVVLPLRATAYRQHP